jgi:hypothetical protein
VTLSENCDLRGALSFDLNTISPEVTDLIRNSLPAFSVITATFGASG